MPASLPEQGRKPGICYASTRDGTELPVIDVTHPAFALDLTDAQLAEMAQRFVEESKRRARIPRPIRKLIFALMMRRSGLARAIWQPEGNFLAAMDTYRMKLGPENLGPRASRVDRRIAGSFPALSMRLRHQDMAHLLAGGLAPVLEARRARPLHLIEIGGGPAIGSLDALIRLERDQARSLAGRPITVHVLDLDQEGPEFGARALAALQAAGGPLQGVEARFEARSYDWNDPSGLRALLGSIPRDAVVSCCSEGALFAYGSDQAIRANLEALRDLAPADLVLAGSVPGTGKAAVHLRSASRISTRLGDLAGFREVLRGAGWGLERVIERPLGYDVRLARV